MRLRDSTKSRTAERVADLSANFSRYLMRFREANRFSGPSLHFHLRTVDRLRQHDGPASAIGDETYIEMLYATLAAWGLHRMGPGNAKLRDFSEFALNARTMFGHASVFYGRSILDLDDRSARDVGRQIGRIIEAHKSDAGLTLAESVLVANSKALHHFLPDLVPPVDRAYTLRFFFERTDAPGSAAETFEAIFPWFAAIAWQNAQDIRDAVACANASGGTRLWDSGHAKVLDNALMGWVHARRSPGLS
jgi:hypothetical protein